MNVSQFVREKNIASRRVLGAVAAILLVVISLRLYFSNPVQTVQSNIPILSAPQNNEDKLQVGVMSPHDCGIEKFNIALGIFSVERPQGAPDYVYIEVMSILDALFTSQPYIHIDKIHVFDGTFNKTGSQVKYFKYSQNVAVHLMNNNDFEIVQNRPVHRKASLNYLLVLKYLLQAYPDASAYLVLEDDVVFDPETALILWRTLKQLRYIHSQLNSKQEESSTTKELKNISRYDDFLFLVDGYVRGPMRDERDEVLHQSVSSNNMQFNSLNGDKGEYIEDVFIPFQGKDRCCSQSFLLSPAAARLAIPLIEQSLNGSVPYLPLDLFLSSSFLAIPNFHFYLARKCWVQHIGRPYLSLGTFHRGCSRMNFETDN